MERGANVAKGSSFSSGNPEILYERRFITGRYPRHGQAQTRQKKCQPYPAESDDEHYANGIFEFNITRLLAFIDTWPEQFPIESVLVDDFADYGGSHLNEETVRNADLSRPILLAEIAPVRFNVIDGNHRLARARREGLQTVPARRVRCPDHVPFLISEWAYEKYVEYWNSKLEELSPPKAPRKPRKVSLRT